MPGLLHAFFYDPNHTFGASPTPFVVLMVAGFVIGVIGHITRTKGLIALGIGMIFLATFLLPLITNVVKSQQ